MDILHMNSRALFNMAIALGLGWYFLRGGKKMKEEQYPNATYASPHFTWDELLVSAGAPATARKYRELYPNGTWPRPLAVELWPSATDKRRLDFQRRVMPDRLQKTVAQNMAEHLERLMEPLREALGGHPMKVISGWRPPEVNQRVGGARLSGHILGIAVDIAANAATKAAAKRWTINRQMTYGDVGYFGLYSWGFHLGATRGFNDGIICHEHYKHQPIT
jgi:hypothetical protein